MNKRDMLYKRLEEIVIELNEKTRFSETKNFIQHGNTSVYDHVISVAIKSIDIALKFNLDVDYDSLIRGALLHDYFLYDWHDGKKERQIHGFTHPKIALREASKDMDLNEIEKDIIVKHMFPLTIIPPKYKESWVVTTADKIVSTEETINRNKPAKVRFGADL